MSEGRSGWLRDPQDAVGNAVLEQARRVAHVYEALVPVAGADAQVAHCFAELAAEHRARADAVAAELRRLGFLTQDVDPDRELADTAVDRVRAWLADDPGRSLVEKRRDAEASLRAAIAEATAVELEPGLRGALEALDATARAACQRLDALAARRAS